MPKIQAILTSDIDLNPGYTFTYIADMGLVEIQKDGAFVAFFGTDRIGDKSGENNTFDSSSRASKSGKFYNADLTLDTTLTLDTLRAWTPIGISRNVPFQGVLDGNGHTVSGLYYNSDDARNIGLVGYASSKATIRSLNVENSLLRADYHLGSIVGYLDYKWETVEKCSSSAILIGAKGTSSVGGIVGYNGGAIRNCYFTGIVVACEDRYGGISAAADSDCKIEYCYTVGTIFSSHWDVEPTSLVCPGLADLKSAKNCYYLAKEEDYRGGKSAEQFASGEVAFLLQADQESAVWGQTIGKEAVPVWNGSKVYTSTPCPSYSNAPLGTKEHVLGAIGCVHCDYIPAASDSDGDGYYEIRTMSDLYWIAQQVNTRVKTDYKMILMNDIDLNPGYTFTFIAKKNVVEVKKNGVFVAYLGTGQSDRGAIYNAAMELDSTISLDDLNIWTPIGLSDSRFEGVLEGNGHTISGMYFNDKQTSYVGLFGAVRCVTIRDVGVVNSYLNGDSFVGGIVGYAYSYDSAQPTRSLLITNCYQTGTVCGGKWVAGICASLNGDINSPQGVISYCYNTGEALSDNSWCGGICATISSNSLITHCYHTGMTRGYGEWTGGICGTLGYSSDMVTNCYVAGSNGGSIVGELNNGSVLSYCYNLAVIGIKNYDARYVIYREKSEKSVVKNCYYYAPADDFKGGKTLEQFASGEVAFLLQADQESAVWGQTIGTDAVPVWGGARVYVTAPCVTYNNSGVTEREHALGAICCGTCGYVPAASDANGDGYYEIYSIADLYWLAYVVNSNTQLNVKAILMNDIDLNPGYTFTFIADTGLVEVKKNGTFVAYLGTGTTGNYSGEDRTFDGTASVRGAIYNAALALDDTISLAALNVWTPIGTRTACFQGVFDGNGHTINGLYFNDGTAQYVGLFGYIENATVKRVGVINAYINADRYIGAIAGYADTSTTDAAYYTVINACYNTGALFGDRTIGGICGYGYKVTLSNCYNTGTLCAENGSIGGICGSSDRYSTITWCYNTGTVRSKGSWAAGICSHLSESLISNCYNTGYIYSTTSYVAGICAYNAMRGKILDCYNLGEITGGYSCPNIAGICGYNYSNSTIQNCYNLGMVQEGYTPKNMICWENEGTVSNCYYYATADNGLGGKTLEQFASGEVTVLLGTAFGQDLESERKDAYPVVGAKRVYKTEMADRPYANTRVIASVNGKLGTDLSLIYYVKTDRVYDKAEMVFTVDGKQVTVVGVYDATAEEYRFVYHGIAPHRIGDLIDASLYLDGTLCDTKIGYSFRKYLYTIARSSATDLGISEEKHKAMKTLIADLFKYGGESQRYQKHRTDDLVSADISKLWLTASTWKTLTDGAYQLNQSTATDLYFTAAGVWFASVNRLYFRFDAANGVENVKVVVRIGDQVRVYTKDDMTLVNGTTYELYTDAISAIGFDTACTVELYSSAADESPVQTLTYSVRSYVYSMQSDTDMGALAKALYNYGLSAKAYAQTA